MASEPLLIRTLLLPLLKQYKDAFLYSSRYYEHVKALWTYQVCFIANIYCIQVKMWNDAIIVITYQVIIITYPTVQVWFLEQWYYYYCLFAGLNLIPGMIPPLLLIQRSLLLIKSKQQSLNGILIIIVARVTVPGYSLFRNGSRIFFISFISDNWS